ncbi:MAG: hypothetical protein GXX86_08445 [Propionibacterium sp.]|nr:hypothetical protein [Propionibacterium sp.]
MKKPWVAVAAGSVAVMTACSGGVTSPGEDESPEPVAEACSEFQRRDLVAPFDTEGDCLLVPKMTVAHGNVGVGFTEYPLGSYFVDLTTGATTELELPEETREPQAVVAPVNGEPMFLVTGYEYRDGDAFNASGAAPFALGFDLQGDPSPIYRATAEWIGHAVTERLVTETDVWIWSGALDLESETWTEVRFDGYVSEIEPYTQLDSGDPIAVFGGNLVHSMVSRARKDSEQIWVSGLYAVAPDGSIAWTNLTESTEGFDERDVVVGYLGRYVLILTATEDGAWQVAWYDGVTGEKAVPEAADLVGHTGLVPRDTEHLPLVVTDDGAFVVLNARPRYRDLVIGIDVEAGTATTLPSENDLEFTAVDGTTVYLRSSHRHTATYDLTTGEAVPLPESTKIPHLTTDRAVVFENVLDEELDFLVTR